MSEKQWTEGVLDDGAVILCDGERVTISDVLARLNHAEHIEAERDALIRDCWEACGGKGPDSSDDELVGTISTMRVGLERYKKALAGQLANQLKQERIFGEARRKLDELQRLAFELADECARSDIEFLCIGDGTWYRTTAADPEEAGDVARALRYLELRAKSSDNPLPYIVERGMGEIRFRSKD